MSEWKVTASHRSRAAVIYLFTELRDVAAAQATG